MFIILNWWADETIANANKVCKYGSDEAMVFKSYEEADDYAQRELNGYFKVVEEL